MNKKFTSRVIIRGAGLGEVLYGVNRYGSKCLWSCESMHMHRRSTDVPVQHGNPLGKLVLQGRWRSDTVFCSKVIDSVILLHDNVRLRTARQTT
jgi:hypothetical protein